MGEFIGWLLSLPARHPELRLDLLGALLLAAVLGGAIGWEREHAHKPAGLRTNILICMGAALLTDLSHGVAAASGGSPDRIAAQIVSGIGFLGAGTIIQARGSVTGLTTAATMWVVAAIGMAVGFGAHVEAVGTTVLVLIALIPLGWMEGKVENGHAPERRRKAEGPEKKVPLGRAREE
jgi:putative Mg2+ transporter-C (MgtC) family protein